jgi:uncharacterized cupin superfamily protein
MKQRPAFIKHWRDIQDEDNACYPDSSELLSIGSPFGRIMGLQRIGIHHEVLPPGRRSSWPHAESEEEEFVYVIEGHPQAWINGELHDLEPGDGVGFPAGTGVTHTFINNSQSNVRLLVIGERKKPNNKIYYAKNPEQKEKRNDWWHDWPRQEMGSHDGLPEGLRNKIIKG